MCSLAKSYKFNDFVKALCVLLRFKTVITKFFFILQWGTFLKCVWVKQQRHGVKTTKFCKEVENQQQIAFLDCLKVNSLRSRFNRKNCAIFKIFAIIGFHTLTEKHIYKFYISLIFLKFEFVHDTEIKLYL